MCIQLMIRSLLSFKAVEDAEDEEKDEKEERRREKIKAVADKVLERNWNEAFQTIMKLKDGASKYSQLSKLAHDVRSLSSTATML